MTKDLIRSTYNQGVTSCIEIAQYRAKLTREAIASLGLKGTTPDSKEYLVRADVEINTLTSLVQLLERLKI